MGQTVVEAVRGAPDLQVVAEVDLGDSIPSAIEANRPEVVVDFTVPGAIADNLEHYLEHRVHPVVGTTGLSGDALDSARERSRELELGGLVAPNFALGAVLMMELAARAARYLGAVEITEYHHPAKLDAPSGTSLRTREKITNEQPESREIPIHSVRLPGFLASQEVFLGGEGERLTIRHDSLDRRCFMPGVLLAVRRVSGLKELVVGLEALLDLKT